MRMNKMTSYAIRIISRMAQENRTISSRELVEEEEIPHGVLMKVLRMLKAGGIVTAHQGRGGLGGGYSLNASADSISIYQLFLIMEGEVNMHPAIEKERYLGDKKKLYEKLEDLNDEWTERLKQVRIGDFIG